MNQYSTIPLVNGVEHSWASIAILIGNTPVIGVRGISYKDEQEMEDIYGIGAFPVARGYGRIKCSGNITLLRSEVEAIRDASPTGRLQDIAPFTITVAYIPVNGQVMKNHVLRNCQFKNDDVEWKEGDISNEVTLELLISNIIR